MPQTPTALTVKGMTKLTRTILTGAILAITLHPGTAHADTLCGDGTISNSNGGSGTCSWHGGISGNDYSYSPDYYTPTFQAPTFQAPTFDAPILDQQPAPVYYTPTYTDNSADTNNNSQYIWIGIGIIGLLIWASNDPKKS